MRAALFMLSLAACMPSLPGTTFQTACGLSLMGNIPHRDPTWPLDAPNWSEAAIQAVEDGVIDQFPKANDDRLKDVCRTISEFSFFIREERFWNHPLYGGISGLTDCDKRLIEIGNSPPDRSALTHELAHAAQRCMNNACAHPGADVDVQHFCWRENGIYLAAANANLEASKVLDRKDGGQ